MRVAQCILFVISYHSTKQEKLRGRSVCFQLRLGYLIVALLCQSQSPTDDPKGKENRASRKIKPVAINLQEMNHKYELIIGESAPIDRTHH